MGEKEDRSAEGRKKGERRVKVKFVNFHHPIHAYPVTMSLTRDNAEKQMAKWMTTGDENSKTQNPLRRNQMTTGDMKAKSPLQKYQMPKKILLEFSSQGHNCPHSCNILNNI